MVFTTHGKISESCQRFCLLREMSFEYERLINNSAFGGGDDRSFLAGYTVVYSESCIFAVNCMLT